MASGRALRRLRAARSGLAAGQGGFKGLCSEMEHRRVLHSGAGGEVLMAFPLTLLLEEGGSRVEISHLEHFRKLCRPGLHWYPTHFRNKRGNGWGTGVYSKSENALEGRGEFLRYNFYGGYERLRPDCAVSPGRELGGLLRGGAKATAQLIKLCSSEAILRTGESENSRVKRR